MAHEEFFSLRVSGDSFRTGSVRRSHDLADNPDAGGHDSAASCANTGADTNASANSNANSDPNPHSGAATDDAVDD